MLSMDEHPENISVKVLVLVLASNSCDGTLLSEVQPLKQVATVVTALFRANRPAGMVSSAVQFRKAFRKVVAPVSPSKIPDGMLLSAAHSAKSRSHLAALVFGPKSTPIRSSAGHASIALV